MIQIPTGKLIFCSGPSELESRDVLTKEFISVCKLAAGERYAARRTKSRQVLSVGIGFGRHCWHAQG